jgi:hypothetical protein
VIYLTFLWPIPGYVGECGRTELSVMGAGNGEAKTNVVQLSVAHSNHEGAAMSQVTTSTTATKDNDASKGKNDPPKALGIAGTVVAIVLIGLWIVVLGLLWLHIDDAEARWARSLVLFHSVEAVAFAAAGALLGVQVKRAQAAEKSEKEAKTEAAKEKKISQLGERLASTVLIEKNHAPLTLETEHHLFTNKTGMPLSVHLAQELLDARGANP